MHSTIWRVDTTSNILLHLAISFLVSMSYGVYTIVIYRSIRDDFLLISFWFPWTLGHTCDSFCF